MKRTGLLLKIEQERHRKQIQLIDLRFNLAQERLASLGKANDEYFRRRAEIAQEALTRPPAKPLPTMPAPKKKGRK